MKNFVNLISFPDLLVYFILLLGFAFLIKILVVDSKWVSKKTTELLTKAAFVSAIIWMTYCAMKFIYLVESDAIRAIG